MISPFKPLKFFVDLETTGFCPIRNDVLEAVVLVVNESDEIINKWKGNSRPDFNHWGGEHVHGISAHAAAKFPTRREFCISFLQFLVPYKDEINRTHDFFYHGKNRFDYRFFEWAFRKEDLQYSFWKVFSEEKVHSTIPRGTKNNSLDVWAKRIGFNIKHHDAESDVYCCFEVYKYLKVNEIC